MAAKTSPAGKYVGMGKVWVPRNVYTLNAPSDLLGTLLTYQTKSGFLFKRYQTTGTHGALRFEIMKPNGDKLPFVFAAAASGAGTGVEVSLEADDTLLVVSTSAAIAGSLVNIFVWGEELA